MARSTLTTARTTEERVMSVVEAVTTVSLHATLTRPPTPFTIADPCSTTMQTVERMTRRGSAT